MEVNVSSSMFDDKSKYQIATFLVKQGLQCQIISTLSTVSPVRPTVSPTLSNLVIERGFKLVFVEENLVQLKNVVWPYLSQVYGCNCGYVKSSSYTGCLLNIL